MRALLVCTAPQAFERTLRSLRAEGWSSSAGSTFRSREVFCRILHKEDAESVPAIQPARSKAMSQSASAFDPVAFMQAQFTGSNDTQYKPCPVGEYPAIIDSVTPRQWTKKDDPSKSGVALDVIWSIDSQVLREELNRDKVVVSQGIMLDLSPSGALDMGPGRNINLGRLRDCLGLNDPSQPFSFGMLVGKVAKVKVTHELYNNAPMAKVTGVVRL